MNVGLGEAVSLAEKLRKVLREEAPLASLDAYNRERQNEWHKLLGVKGGLRVRATTDAWVRSRFFRILSCRPASGSELKRAADRLGLDLE